MIKVTVENFVARNFCSDSLPFYFTCIIYILGTEGLKFKCVIKKFVTFLAKFTAFPGKINLTDSLLLHY